MDEPNRTVDLLILGAGPAGANAALRAHALGLSVLLIDENPAPGGQVYRAMPPNFQRGTDISVNPDTQAGDLLRSQLTAHNIHCLMGHKVWNVGSSLRTDVIGPNGTMSVQPRALLLASGTTERVIPFNGWTQPGVMGLAAATVLLKSQNMLPGKRTVVAGAGPLLWAVASNILKAGGEVVAVVDLASRSEWLSRVPSLLQRPDLLRQGFQWQLQLLRARVPIFARHAVRSVRETVPGQLEVVIGMVDALGAPVSAIENILQADAVAVGNGLIPNTEVTRLLKAKHRYAPEQGGWVAQTDEHGRTSIPGLYIAGDGAGIAGAAAAGLQGELVALACAQDLGFITEQELAGKRKKLQKKWSSSARFGHAMAGLMSLREGVLTGIGPNTVICRCEDVTRAEIDSAIDEGATNMNQLKAWTRCGMGPCQGRTCSDVVGALLAHRLGSHREDVGFFTGRAPLRPVSLAEVAGDYTYADIPIPKAAPL